LDLHERVDRLVSLPNMIGSPINPSRPTSAISMVAPLIDAIIKETAPLSGK
jgi:hypothetical protein